MELTVTYTLDENSEECRELYIKWEQMLNSHHVPEWDYFEPFAAYCIGQRFQIGDRVVRRNAHKPFGPDNCRVERKGHTIAEAEAIDRWNRTVALWRMHYGLPPLKT